MISQSSKEIVERCLTFDTPIRMPRQLWLLPWAEDNYPLELNEIKLRFPNDFTYSDFHYKPSTLLKGDPYKKGLYVDEWGCEFNNIKEGIIGEIKNPILKDICDWKYIEPPYDQLPKGSNEIDSAYSIINRFYLGTNKFVIANSSPRPWERYQFLRGTENAMMDIMMLEDGVKEMLSKIHDFYLRELEFWVKSDIDAIFFMDDWGTQNQLLIPPELWREMFKPLYKEYCELAHSHNKYVFMHSDGFIEDIYPDLIEIGVDALNSQLACMDLDYLMTSAKGKITFWGEIDRQHVLSSNNPDDGRKAVREIAEKLYDPRGGMIFQLEFGIGANPNVVSSVFEEWEQIENELKNLI